MNSEREHDLTAAPVGPPWSLDVIADLQAGVFSPEIEAELRSRMAQDRDAQEMLTALNAVSDELSLLPPLRMPDRYAARLDAAITAESRARSVPAQRPAFEPPPRPFLTSIPGRAPAPAPAPAPQFVPAGGGFSGGAPDNVRSLDAARRRRRGVFAGLGIAAAAAAIAVVSVTALGHNKEQTGSASPGATVSVAPTSQAPNALEIDPNNLQDAYAQINGKKQTSGIDALTYTACLAANGITGTDILGVSDATYQGQPVIAIAVTVDATHAEVYVVGQKCGLSGADLLTKTLVNR